MSSTLAVGKRHMFAVRRAGDGAAALVRSLSPAVALVMYGSNDATTRFVPLDDLARLPHTAPGQALEPGGRTSTVQR